MILFRRCVFVATLAAFQTLPGFAKKAAKKKGTGKSNSKRDSDDDSHSTGSDGDKSQSSSDPSSSSADSSAAFEPLLNCKTDLRFTSEPPRSHTSQSFCSEHADYTCCEAPHVNRIMSKYHEHGVGMIRTKSCEVFTRKALCATCDGDVGTGLRGPGVGVRGTKVHLCPTYCNKWFNSCLDEFWLPRGPSNDRELVPCNADVGCQTLGDLFPGHENQDSSSGRSLYAQEFCEQAFRNFGGFEIANPEDEPDLCFDGVPSARYKKGLSESERQRRESASTNNRGRWKPWSWSNPWQLWNQVRSRILYPLRAEIRHNPKMALLMVMLMLLAIVLTVGNCIQYFSRDSQTSTYRRNRMPRSSASESSSSEDVQYNDKDSPYAIHASDTVELTELRHRTRTDAITSSKIPNPWAPLPTVIDNGQESGGKESVGNGGEGKDVQVRSTNLEQ